jgi:hypothetical protein
MRITIAFAFSLAGCVHEPTCQQDAVPGSSSSGVGETSQAEVPRSKVGWFRGASLSINGPVLNSRMRFEPDGGVCAAICDTLSEQTFRISVTAERRLVVDDRTRSDAFALTSGELAEFEELLDSPGMLLAADHQVTGGSSSVCEPPPEQNFNYLSQLEFVGADGALHKVAPVHGCVLGSAADSQLVATSLASISEWLLATGQKRFDCGTPIEPEVDEDGYPIGYYSICHFDWECALGCKNEKRPTMEL